MAIFKEWVDFVIFPYDPDRATTLQHRLWVEEAIDTGHITTSSQVKAEFDDLHDKILKFGRLIKKSALVRSNDAFEAMEITDWGSITIWTQQLVYTVVRDGGNERLRAFPRNPPTFT